MAQLGFTFYPKDWWTSDSFYALNPFERYIYLELLFMMYDNEGSIKNNKVMVERRLMTTIKDDVWLKISDLMVKDGDQLTHKSVNKRLLKAITSRENGKKGGRPKGNEKDDDEKPRKPNNETQEKTQNNPPYKREREIESKRENESEVESDSPPAISPENYLDGIKHMELLDCAKAYFNSPRYQRAIDLLCMGQKVSVNGLKNLAMAFNEHCSLKGKVSRTLDDWASHFSNWVKDPKRNSNNQNSDEESATERRKRLLEEQRQRNAG